MGVSSVCLVCLDCECVGWCGEIIMTSLEIIIVMSL